MTTFTTPRSTTHPVRSRRAVAVRVGLWTVRILTAAQFLVGGLLKLTADPRLAGHHRVHAVRAHLLRAAGHPKQAAEEYRVAAQRTLSRPERRYLLQQARGTRALTD